MQTKPSGRLEEYRNGKHSISGLLKAVFKSLWSNRIKACIDNIAGSHVTGVFSFFIVILSTTNTVCAFRQTTL